MNNEFLMFQNRAQINLFVIHVYFISYIVSLAEFSHRFLLLSSNAQI